MSNSDAFLYLTNISYNVRNLYFVLDIFRKNCSQKWLEMVLTDGRHQAIVFRNVVPEHGRVYINISQNCCEHTLGYVKQDV